MKSEDKLAWWGENRQGEEPKAKPSPKPSAKPMPKIVRRSKPKSEPESKPKPGSKPKSGSKSKSDSAKRRLPLGVRLLIHAVVIGVVVLLVSLLSHFLLLSITRHNAHTSVPRFESLLVDEAQALAEEHGLNLVVSDSVYVQIYEGGLVLEQNPKSGVEVKPGRSIYVTINALQREMVDVPYVAGRSLRQAKNMLEVAGLDIGELIYEPDLATNYVLSQSYDGQAIDEGAELRVPRGSGIVLHVGVNKDADSVVVPQLIGMSLYEARSALLVSGLNVGRVGRDVGVTLEQEKLARIFSQSIVADERVVLGRSIGFDITLDHDQVERVLESIAEAKVLEQRMMAEEQAMLDSINRIFHVEEVVEDTRPQLPSGGSGFEDLF